MRRTRLLLVWLANDDADGADKSGDSSMAITWIRAFAGICNRDNSFSKSLSGALAAEDDPDVEDNDVADGDGVDWVMSIICQCASAPKCVATSCDANSNTVLQLVVPTCCVRYTRWRVGVATGIVRKSFESKLN